ncbi:MAG: AAA domain-containing protein [Bacteroidaceae bacterium]|nr:AAA domain-containing protein [Bacteroidaceae bacterium]
MGVLKKVRRGMCWFPLSVGRSYYNSLDQLVVEVSRTADTDVEHLFEPGKPVCFFQEDASGMLSYMKFVAQVSFVEENRMVIALPSAQALTQLSNADRLGVQLYLDEYTYRLMFQALDTVISAKDNRLAQLRDICHTSAPASQFSFEPVRFPWLNASQEKAADMVLRAKDVAVVHGPPGTGKTTTLVEAIYETLRREVQVLVCAQSNMAVDWISEKLSERGVNILRIGNPTRVTDRMLNDTYERRFERHPLYDQLWGIRRNIRQLYDSREGNRENRHQKIARLKERATELEYTINESLFTDARVIACTLTGSAHHLLQGRRFGTLFIDEAAQALEASCWIAIQKADRVVLAGDHRQLPPTIKSPAALSGGLDKTLMQTICENKPRCVSMLNVQYRMCDEIMQFPNREFYDGLLHSDPSVKYRGILDWDTAIEWVESDLETENGKRKTENEDLTPKSNSFHLSDFTFPFSSGETLASDGLSRINPVEAELALQTLHNYIERIGKDRILHERLDIGIISPYKGQVQLLRRMLRKDSYWKPLRHLISINTVDGFQGQERDIILISMVRNNEQGQVGFLSDLRRMNVAITRARMKLIIIGHSPTLCRHPFYKRLKHYIDNITEY